MAGRRYDGDGAYDRAMKAARVAFWQHLMKTHPTATAQALGKLAGLATSTVCRMLREAGYEPVTPANVAWQRKS